MSPAILSIIIILIVVGGVVLAGTHTLDYFSAERREVRAHGKQVKTALANSLRREAIATSTLSKIAANDSGNPALEAQIALEEINKNKLAELES